MGCPSATFYWGCYLIFFGSIFDFFSWVATFGRISRKLGPRPGGARGIEGLEVFPRSLPWDHQVFGESSFVLKLHFHILRLKNIGNTISVPAEIYNVAFHLDYFQGRILFSMRRARHPAPSRWTSPVFFPSAIKWWKKTMKNPGWKTLDLKKPGAFDSGAWRCKMSTLASLFLGSLRTP